MLIGDTTLIKRICRSPKVAMLVGIVFISSLSVGILLLSAPNCCASASNIYLAQNATANNDGTSCANAYAYTFFNNGSNWGSGTSQIGPGTEVHICGTITDSLNGTLLTAQGSGASGNPVWIHFETGAVLQSPGESTFINGNGQSYFLIDGGPTCGYVNGSSVACNGVIRNTLNGFAGASCPGGTCSNQVGTQAIGGFASNLEVKNLHIGPIYIHGGTSDLTFTAPGPECINFTTGGGNINIHNNTMHDAGWCMNGGGNQITVANNEIFNSDHALGEGIYSDSPVTWTGQFLHDNYIHDPANWDQTNNAFHHDGIHLFAYCGTNVGGNNTYCPASNIVQVEIYNNRIGGNWGQHNTAGIFFEGNIGSTASPANIFNNVCIFTAGAVNNGCWNGYGNTVNEFNNTAIGCGSACQTYKIIGIMQGPAILSENNIATDAAPVSSNGPWPTGGASGCPYTLPAGAGGGTQNCISTNYVLKNNFYTNPADFPNGFGYTNCTGARCSGNGFLGFDASSFASFEAGAPETGGIFRDSAGTSRYLNTNTGQELTGSPSIAGGLNLTNFCTSLGIPGNPCLQDIAGNERPNGVWDIGAYVFSGASANQPAPPTGLTATVN
jgi:hypothetical protein